MIARDKRNRAKPAEPESAYHHGDLQEALIAATEAILADQGARVRCARPQGAPAFRRRHPRIISEMRPGF